MVRFTCQRNWPRGCPRAGQTLPLGVSTRVFREEISIWVRRLGEAGLPSPAQWASACLLRDALRRKGWRSLNLHFLPELGSPLLLCSVTWASDLRIQTGLRHKPFLVLQLAVGISWDFLASIITRANTHTPYWFCFLWKKTWLIHSSTQEKFPHGHN